MIQDIYQNYEVIKIFTDTKREADVILTYAVNDVVGSPEMSKYTGCVAHASGITRRISGGYEIQITFENEYAVGAAVNYFAGFIRALNILDWK